MWLLGTTTLSHLPPELHASQRETTARAEKFHCFINKILQKSLSSGKVTGVHTAWPDTEGLTRWGRGRTGHTLLRTPGPPCSLCQPEYGLWLMCKNKIWGGWQGCRMEGLTESPAAISPLNLGTPTGQAERRTPSQGLLGLQTRVAGQHRGVGAGGGGGLGPGYGGAWQRACLSPRCKASGISWGWAWGCGQGLGLGPQPQSSWKALAREDGRRAVGKGSWAGARQGPR